MKPLARQLAGTPSPQWTVSCFFPCSAQHFSEGTSLHLRDDPAAEWVVKKTRYVGEPVDRMCEAVRMHAKGVERTDASTAHAIWQQLPGVAKWSPIENMLTGKARASAKVVAPAGSAGAMKCLGPHMASSTGPCAPLLFVARTVTNASLAASAAIDANRTMLLARVHRDVTQWRKGAADAKWRHGRQQQKPQMTRRNMACSEPGGADGPRIYTADGLRAALASGTCSRACAAARMRRRLELQPDFLKAGDPRPCLLGGGHAHCRTHGGSVLLIVSRWQAHLAHLQLQPFCYLVVEKAESPFAQQQGVDYVVPNRANEASSYLHFLSRHYDDALPDTMVFMQDERISKHSKDMIHMLPHLHLDAAPYLPLNSVHLPFLHPKAFCHVRTCVEQSGLLRRLGLSVSPSNHMDLAYTCCAQFLVSAEAVRAHPRSLYEDLFRYTLGGGDFGQRGDSFARGECLEVLWHALFGRPKVSEPTPAALRCGRSHQLAHRCKETSGLVSFVPANDSFWSWAAPVWQQLSDSQRAEIRAGGPSGSLFRAAVQGGHLCLSGADGTIGECERPTDASITRALGLMERGIVRARVRALGGVERDLSTNCTVLDRQDVVATRRRKFARTLRQACAGLDESGSSSIAAAVAVATRPNARRRRGRGRPLHHLALCSLFNANPGATREFLRRLRSAPTQSG